MTARKSMTNRKALLNPFEQVYEIVKQIPPGKVLTYGLISKKMNGRLSAAAVGWAMNALGTGQDSRYTSATVPWHRVINSKGGLSTNHESGIIGPDERPLKLQQVMLQQEGVVFRADNTVDLSCYLWKALTGIQSG